MDMPVLWVSLPDRRRSLRMVWPMTLRDRSAIAVHPVHVRDSGSLLHLVSTHHPTYTLCGRFAGRWSEKASLLWHDEPGCQCLQCRAHTTNQMEVTDG